MEYNFVVQILNQQSRMQNASEKIRTIGRDCVYEDQVNIYRMKEEREKLSHIETSSDPL